ncbi:MAG: adenylosuccinase ade13 [Watsoniomyces obsoletus]|nr:MAG: adenylosuccinase ade13 [Watsoniomyces obsoletus]
MAEQQDHQQPATTNTLSSAFPAPPPFWKHFTTENVARVKEIQQQSGVNDEEENVDDNIPTELRYLIPPKPPISGTYRSFGATYNVVDTLPSLEEQGIEQLYPSPSDPDSVNTDATQSEWTHDRAFYLQKIAKSLLLNFMELVGVLSVDPSQYGKKVEDLRTLFINAHHLLNEYRPHQARETLIQMMQQQLQRSRAETEGIRRMKKRVEEVLEGIAKNAEQVVNERTLDGHMDDDRTPEEMEMEEQRSVWEALQRMEVGGV